MKTVRIGKALFDLNRFVYAEETSGMMSSGCRIWFDPNGSSIGSSTPGSPPAGFKPYVDVAAKIWEVQEAIEKASSVNSARQANGEEI